MSATEAVHNEISGIANASGASVRPGEQEKRPPVCLVLGMAGSGKTTLVDALASFAEGVSYIDKELNSLNPEVQDNEQTGNEDEGKIASSVEEKAKRDADPDFQEDTVPSGQEKTRVQESKEYKGNIKLPESTEQKDAIVAARTDGDADRSDDVDGDGDDVGSLGEEGDNDEVENQVFVINIDPAVHETPYQPNVDIRDVIKFQGVMREYGLGPNGAIMTSLNLYATRFDQVLEIVERRRKDVSLFVVDTPGQIETFTWSASGMIITDALAMTLPTVALFVVDTSRASAPMTFVSNMLYACSILYKTRLPLVVVFNKTDVADAEKLNRWMRDFDEFDNALNDERFSGNLARSLAMALDQFYTTIPTVAVSAQTGAGMPELLDTIHKAASQYDKEYRPILESRMQARALEKTEKMQQDLERFRKDAADDPLRQMSPDKDGGPTMGKSRLGDEDSIRSRLNGPQDRNSGEGDESEADEEEQEAYEELKRYLEAIKAKRK